MWEQIRANQRRSAVLVIAMVFVLIALGLVAGMALAGTEGAMIGVAVALIIFGLQWSIYAVRPEFLLLQGAFASELKHDDSPRLFNIVEEMRLASGISFTPRVYLIDDPAPNAFAIGNKPEASAIAVTTGLLQRLNRDELQGVIAHEIGHLKNRDVQFMTLAAVMLGSIVILSNIIWRIFRYGGRGRRRSSSRGSGQAAAILFLIALVFAILGPLVAQLLFFACSRKREYLADASSAQFTRYPEGLASALEKISASSPHVTFVNKAIAPMFIINPLEAAASGSGSWFSTHPSTRERIRILRGMNGAAFADYEAAYRRARGSGVMGAVSLRDRTPVGIRTASNEGPVETRHEASNLVHRTSGYLPLRCHCGLELSVPEGYERDTIRCVRCGSLLPIPVAAPPTSTMNHQASLQYRRTGHAWESFRCACGRTIQISPAFSAPTVRCNNCGRQISVL